MSLESNADFEVAIDQHVLNYLRVYYICILMTNNNMILFLFIIKPTND